MNYKLILPENYQKVKLPGLSAWVADLRANGDKQGKGILKHPETGQYCCLGRLSELQGRLTCLSKRDEHEPYFTDGDGYSSGLLAISNPLYDVFGITGAFPLGVSVRCEGRSVSSMADNLVFLNDLGCPFSQIAEFLEHLYYE
jgi:hypothetical protein